jgi:hypothetical protein
MRSTVASNSPPGPSALAAVEQRDAIARLQAQHLHMARGAGGQVDFGTGGQGSGAVEAGHLLYFHSYYRFIYKRWNGCFDSKPEGFSLYMRP